MDRQSKILILHASVGFGHTQAAKAVEEALRKQSYFERVTVLDTLSLQSKLFQTIYNQSFVLQVKYAPWLWGFFYNTMNLRWLYRGLMRFVRHVYNRIGDGRLQKILIDENPDVVICTHFFSVEVASYLKKYGKIKSKIISVITDFRPHYVWVSDQVDFYVTASKESKEELLQMGAALNQIKLFGIPVSFKFALSRPKADALARQGLDPNLFTVLVTSGGAGLDTTKQLVEGLSRSATRIQMLIVCGKNQDMYKAFADKFSGNKLIKVYGFVNFMDELMDAADVIVGKGGGLTVSESMAKQKPMILFCSTPGQETRNDKLLEAYGAGFATCRVTALVSKIKELSENPTSLERMKQAVLKLSTPHSAETLAEFLKNEL